MSEIGVVAYQMTRIEETNTLVPFSFLLPHSSKSNCQKTSRTCPLKTGPGADYETYQISRYQLEILHVGTMI